MHWTLLLSALLAGVADCKRFDASESVGTGEPCDVCSRRHLTKLAAVGRDKEEWEAAVLRAGVNGSFLEASLDSGEEGGTSSTGVSPRWPKSWSGKLKKTATVVGAGAFGKVYIATIACDGTMVAIKQLSSASASKREMQKEAALLEAFSPWPQFAAYFASGRGQDGSFYIMMEAALGKDMSSVIDNRRHATPQDKQQLFLDLVEGVAQMHRMGIVHRDLKPANVLVTRKCSGEVPCHAKVGDLGLACSLRKPSKVAGVDPCSSSVAGTPLYIAPESYKHSQIHLKNDMWALGLILYELQFQRLPPKLASATSLKSLEKAIMGLSITSDPNVGSIQGTMKDLITGMLTHNLNSRLSAEEALALTRKMVGEATLCPTAELPSCYSAENTAPQPTSKPTKKPISEPATKPTGKPTRHRPPTIQDAADVEEVERESEAGFDFFVIRKPKTNIAMNYFFPQGVVIEDSGFADKDTGVVRTTVKTNWGKTYDIAKMLAICKKKKYLDTDLKPGDKIVSVNNIAWPLSETDREKLKDGLLGDLVFKYIKA